MKKWIAIAATLVVVVGTAGTLVKFPALWHGDDSDEERAEQAEANGKPSEGDFWAWRASYPTFQFNPLWLVDAAEQEKQMLSASPAGERTYSRGRASDSPLALDPDVFTPLGPTPLNNTQMSYGSVGGRINVLVVDPSDPTIAYAGSDGGGVWKTTNCCTASTEWKVMTDVPQISSTAISDLSLDPNNPNVLYAGTGDLRYGSFSFGSAGVLKTTDKGETWEVLGSEIFGMMYPGSANGFPQYQSVGKVRVDPNNSNMVVAGTKTGLYFSYDAGQNWAGPCFTNNYTDGATAQRQDITGLEFVNNGNGTSRIYAALGARGNATPVQPDLNNTGANGVYRLAVAPTSGCPAVADWSLRNGNWPVGTGNGIGDPTQPGRIELAISPSQPSTMYAMAANQTTSQVLGVWRSDDAGETWVAKATAAQVARCGSDSSSIGGGSQMWYDAGLSVHPTNPEITVMSAFDVFRSTNGGSNYADITCGWTTKPSGSIDHVHVDHHARTFMPNNPEAMLVGSDGGVYYTENASAPFPNFRHLNSTFNTIEFYYGDITAGFATVAAPKAAAGAQDNGCSIATFAAGPGPVQWNSTCGGDGTIAKNEPILGNVWFNSSQNGALARSTNGGNSSYSTASGNTGGTWGGDILSFIMPYDIYKWGDTSIPGSGCTTTEGCNHMIAGTNRIWEHLTISQTAGGTPFRALWRPRTGNLTKNNLTIPSGNRSFLNGVNYSFTDPTIAATASNDGNVFMVFGLGIPASVAACSVTNPAGCANAVDLTDNNAVLPNRPIFDVVFDIRSPLVAYAAVGGFDANTPTTPGHVFRVTCAADCATFTWDDKTGNLPNIPVAAIMVNPNAPGQVFAGTDWGLYYTDNIDAAVPEWFRFESFPHVMVWDLVVDRGYTTLAAFTRSRGAWAWPLPNAQIGTSSDIAVSKTGPSSVAAGNNVNYTITVTNSGPNNAANVMVTDMTPAGLGFVANAGDCVTAFPCSLGTIAIGESRTITATLSVPSDYDTTTSISNVASASSDSTDPNMANNTATVVTPVSNVADMSLTMTGPATVARGGTATYRISVRNNSPSLASNVQVSAATPAGLTFTSNSGACANAFPCTLTGMGPGVTQVIDATFAVPLDYAGQSPFLFAANVTSDSSDTNPSNNASSFSTRIYDVADLSISQAGPAAMLPNGNASYVVTVTNNGPARSSNVDVSNPTPAGLTVVSFTGACTASPCILGTMEPNESRTFTATFNVPAGYASNRISNIAYVSSATTDDPDLNNNAYVAFTTVGAGADISVISSAPATVVRGGRFDYTATVTNNGPYVASAANLSAAIPAGLVITGSSAGCGAGGSCALDGLAVGESRTVTISLCVPASYSGSANFVIDANGSSATIDPYLGNNASGTGSQLSFDALLIDGFDGSCQ